MYETLQTSNGLRNYTFERAVAFNINDPKPVMLLRDNRAWLDTNDLAAILPSKEGKVDFAIVYLDEGPTNVDRKVKVAPNYVFNLMEVNLASGKSKIRKKLRNNVIDAVVSPDGDFIAEISFHFTNISF